MEKKHIIVNKPVKKVSDLDRMKSMLIKNGFEYTVRKVEKGFILTRPLTPDDVEYCSEKPLQTHDVSQMPGQLICQRCFYAWWRRGFSKPGRCPKCGSASWQTPRTGKEVGRKPKSERK